MTRAPGPYRVADNKLWLKDEELLGGPLLQLEWFRDVLNITRPKIEDLAAALRALITMTRDCSFAPGERLLSDGTPLRIIQPQKRRKPE